MSKDITRRLRSFSCELALFAALGGCASPTLLAPPPKAASVVQRAPAAAPPIERPVFENHGGMWLPAQMPEHAAELSKLGLAIDPALLSDPQSSI